MFGTQDATNRQIPTRERIFLRPTTTWPPARRIAAKHNAIINVTQMLKHYNLCQREKDIAVSANLTVRARVNRTVYFRWMKMRCEMWIARWIVCGTRIIVCRTCVLGMRVRAGKARALHTFICMKFGYQSNILFHFDITNVILDWMPIRLVIRSIVRFHLAFHLSNTSHLSNAHQQQYAHISVRIHNKRNKCLCKRITNTKLRPSNQLRSGRKIQSK